MKTKHPLVILDGPPQVANLQPHGAHVRGVGQAERRRRDTVRQVSGVWLVQHDRLDSIFLPLRCTSGLKGVWVTRIDSM